MMPIAVLAGRDRNKVARDPSCGLWGLAQERMMPIAIAVLAVGAYLSGADRSVGNGRLLEWCRSQLGGGGAGRDCDRVAGGGGLQVAIAKLAVD